MTAEEMIVAYEAEPLDLDSMTRYEQWALTFFHKPDHLQDPFIDMTLQLDITEAERGFQKQTGYSEGTLTAWLTWGLIQAIREVECFTWRRIEEQDQWYRFANLPLFMPIATGGRERFSELLLEGVMKMDWPTFAETYARRIGEVRGETTVFATVPELTWRMAIFIGNLPKLRFTSLRPHASVARTGRPMFYFGQRYHQDGRLLIPFLAYFDHSNADPVVLQDLLDQFQRITSGH